MHLAIREGSEADPMRRLDKLAGEYQELGNRLGVANCRNSQAALDLKNAEGLLLEALNVLGNVGATGTIGYARVKLGDLYFVRGDADRALAQYEIARTRGQVGAIVGVEANAIIRIGQLLVAAGQQANGIEMIDEGFSLFLGTVLDADRARPGWEAVHAALRAGNEVERQQKIMQARQAWQAAKRLDLVTEWCDVRFGAHATMLG